MVGFIEFNNKHSYDDLGMKILDTIIIPYAARKIITTGLDGSEGDYYADTGGREDIVVPIKFEIIDKNQIKNKYREIKRWLDIVESNHLYIYDDMDYFYKVKHVQLSNFETKYNIYGVVQVNFICSPYMYLRSGQEEISIPNDIFNDTGYIAKPIYIIEGEGLITLTINGGVVTINVGQKVIVDVEKQLIFRNGNIENIRKKGPWENLELLPGMNTISTSGGKVTIIPNFKTI